MTDLDQLLRPGFFRGKECHTKQILDALDADERAKLNAALNDDRVPPTRISEWLARNGFDVKPENLRRHRNRGTNKANRCACPVGDQ